MFVLENEKNMLDKIVKFLFALLFLFFAVFLANTVMTSDSNSKFKKIDRNVYSINDNWICESEKNNYKVSLPHNFKNCNGKIVILRKIDKNTEDNWYIAFYFAATKIKAYLDNKPIYNEDFSKPDGFFSRYSNKKWNLIKLDKDCFGKTLKLEIFTQNTRQKDFLLREIQLGEKNSILFAYILSKTYLISISIGICITLIISALTALISKFMFVKKKSVFFLLVFVILVSLWTLADAQIIQFFITNRMLITFFQYFGLSISALSLFLYAGDIKNFHFIKVFHIIITIFLIYLIAVLSMHFFKIIVFVDIITETHLITTFTSAAVTSLILSERIIYKNKNANIPLFVLLIFTFAYLLTVLFYLIFNKIITDYIILTAVELFLIVLFSALVINSIKSVSIGLRARHFETLAKEDSLTGLNSRFSYILELDYLNSTKAVNFIYVVVIDMNCLKNINDTYGHSYGNTALKLCAAGIKNIFKKDRKYRIGGDEFVVIIDRKISEAKIEKMIARFYTVLKKLSKNIPFEISVAAGFAKFIENEDEHLRDTFNRADKDMYQRKKIIKQTANWSCF